MSSLLIEKQLLKLLEFAGAWLEQRTMSGSQPKGEEDACRMRSLPSGNFGWSSFTR
jgi:hypothetical protein